ncbi:MAG: fibronectin type III domain-containing protein [Eubacterium sp.]
MKKSVKKISTLFLSALMAFSCAILPSGNALAAVSPIKNASSSVKMNFVAWGDSQVATYISSREESVVAASTDLKNAESQIDAMVLAGDITENAVQSEYDTVYDNLADTGISNFITATGNHDIRLGEYSEAKSKFVSFTNKLNAAAGSSLKISSMHYSYSVKGYKFIVMGSDKTMLEEAYINDSQLSWLDSQLKASANLGKPVFVILHQPLKDTHGLPDTWGSSNDDAGSVGEQSDSIKAILNKYKNVFLITGHLHTGFGQYTYQKIGNIHAINLPSVGIDNEDGEYNGSGLGYMVEVYSNKVVFRARDFISGEYLSQYNKTIYLDRVKSISLSTTQYTYNGKAKAPAVSVYDYNGNKISSANYTVTYPSGRKYVGVYKIKITFKGSYAGNPPHYKTFTIKPKGTSISSVSSGSKKFTVKWKKQAVQTTGYQVQYSVYSNFSTSKTLTVSGSSNTSKTVTGLKGGKKYYVRVRTYKTVKVNGKATRIYSSWSKSKAITTKK